MVVLKRAALIDGALILSLLVLGLIGYKLSPLLLPTAEVTVAPSAGCDLNQGACAANVPGGGRLQFALEPRPVAPVVPLQASVALEGLSAERVTLDFSGVDMNMGLNRTTLVWARDRHAGTVTLPVCVTGRMAWRATVIVESGRQRIAVPFTFEVGQ